MKWFGVCLCLLCAGAASAADEDNLRHGAIPLQAEAVAISAATTVTGQHASDSRLEDELFASLDIVSITPNGHGQWLLYVEGNTSPRQRGVASLVAEANHDVGTALDRDDRGRLQVSVLHYLRYLGHSAYAVGLINPAGPLDNSDIANNETSQFLATTLVNDPTIAFPDYTLGFVYFFKPDYRPLDLTFLLSGSSGMGDNPDKSYAELVDVTAKGKGVFAATEVIWRQTTGTWHGGVWVQTANNPYLDGSGRSANNYGVYLSADRYFGRYGVNLRLGLANPKVSEAAQFIGLAVDRAFGRNHAGIGCTYTVVSGDAGPGKGNRTQLEAYYRFEIGRKLSLTPSLQQINNSGFDITGNTIDRDVHVLSLRSSYTF